MRSVEELRAAMEAETQKMTTAGASVSVLCRELGQLQSVYALSPEQRVPSAAVVKVPMLVAALNQVHLGALSLDTRVAVTAELVLPGSLPFEGGPRPCTLEEVLAWMTIAADDTCANVIIDLLGMDNINAFCASLGLANTRLHHRFGATSPSEPNHTSAADIDRLFRMLCSDMLLNVTLNSKALSILWRQRDNSLFRRYIWEEVGVAHQTGYAPGMSHDAGVFFVGGKRVYLGVFVQNAQQQQQNEYIGRMARLVYDHYIADSR